MDTERCHECGELFKEGDDQAEVWLNAKKLMDEAGGQWVLVDDMPESAFGPFLVHQDPCFTGTSMNQERGLPKYELA